MTRSPTKSYSAQFFISYISFFKIRVERREKQNFMRDPVHAPVGRKEPFPTELIMLQCIPELMKPKLLSKIFNIMSGKLLSPANT